LDAVKEDQKPAIAVEEPDQKDQNKETDKTPTKRETVASSVYINT
jgi:hypothetical protein